MIIHDKPLSWYIDKLKNKEYFSQGMYGDGEWVAIFGSRVGKVNAEDTVYTKELCKSLEKSLHFKAKNFLFSAPAVVNNKEVFGAGIVDMYLNQEKLKLEFYEKDIWDKEMREGGLVPFINQLRKMNVVIISNENLRALDFLKYDHFIEISYPNCFKERERVKKEILDYGKPGVYLFSAGLPAAVFVQDVHDKIENSFFLDVGSIWDAYVGIGAQRGWRAELYDDLEKYNKWRKHLEKIV